MARRFAQQLLRVIWHRHGRHPSPKGSSSAPQSHHPRRRPPVYQEQDAAVERGIISAPLLADTGTLSPVLFPMRQRCGGRRLVVVVKVPLSRRPRCVAWVAGADIDSLAVPARCCDRPRVNPWASPRRRAPQIVWPFQRGAVIDHGQSHRLSDRKGPRDGAVISMAAQTASTAPWEDFRVPGPPNTHVTDIRDDAPTSSSAGVAASTP